MREKLSRIFGLPKCSFDAPSDSFEQDVLFIEIEEAQSRIAQGKAVCRARGHLVVYSQSNRLPFGFFSKRISLADSADTKDFFFFDMDVEPLNSPARMVNISERRCSFQYLFEAQHDPNLGELTELELSGGE